MLSTKKHYTVSRTSLIKLYQQHSDLKKIFNFFHLFKTRSGLKRWLRYETKGFIEIYKVPNLLPGQKVGQEAEGSTEATERREKANQIQNTRVWASQGRLPHASGLNISNLFFKNKLLSVTTKSTNYINYWIAPPKSKKYIAQ